MLIAPHRTRLGNPKWLELNITDFKFKGPGWYANGTILVEDLGDDQYMAHLFNNDPRESFKQALEQPDVDTDFTPAVPDKSSS